MSTRGKDVLKDCYSILPLPLATFVFRFDSAMPLPTSIKLDYIIHSLSGDNPSLSVLHRRVKERGYIISKSNINRSLKHEGKRRQARINGQVFKVDQQSRKLSLKVLATIKRKFTVENPPTFEKVAGSMRLAPSTIHKAVTDRLGMVKQTKRRVHVLLERDRQNRKRTSRKLYEEKLSGDKSDFVVTLDECWIEVKSEHSSKDHYYVDKNERKEERKFVQQVNKSFPPKFMIVGSMCCDKVFPLFRVPSSVTVDAKYFVDYVLHPLIHDFLVPHYKEDINKVTIHFDKATSHTAKLSSRYLERVKREYGISFLKKEDIPVKGADIAPIDFFAFGYLKQQLKVTRARTEAGVWKRTREIWSQITPKTCALVFESWKRRLLAVRHNSGGHVEQTKNIHRTKMKL